MQPVDDNAQRWMARLTDSGAPPAAATAASDPQAPPPDGAFRILPVPHLSALRVRGPEAHQFLTNLLSSDPPEAGQDARFAALCNPKGRMQALMRVCRERGAQPQPAFLLVVTGELAEALEQRLRLYVLRTKVALHAVAPHEVVAGIEIGPQSAAHAASGALDALADAGALFPLEQTPDRLLGVFPRERLQHWYAQWRAERGQDPPTAAATRWRLLDVRQGLPSLWAATAEKFVPQMVNLDLLGGVSFTKGCFPGQEIVARMHFLGQVKRRMVPFRAPLPLAPGQTLRTLDGGNPAGEVVDAVALGEGCEGLAVMQLQALDRPIGAAAEAGAGQPVAIAIGAPPYAIPELRRAAP